MLSQSYKRYVLATLTLVGALNYTDRGMMGLMLQPIKEDLDLSDTQLGFLTGIAFALFYATLGLPLARAADRGNRVTLTSIAIGLWGITVMLCLFVTNFVQLLFARIAAAVGEAGCVPPTYSLVGDYFPGSTERARAVAIYMLSSPLSSLISFIAGGWLNDLIGWRLTFFVMGIPGLLLALIVKLTVNEPREKAAPEQGKAQKLPGMTSVLRIMWRQRSMRHITLAIILLLTMGQGLGPWYAAFLMRSHGMHTSELGLWFGLIFGFCGLAGTLLGGLVADRWFADNERGQMRLCAVTSALSVPCILAFLLLPQKQQALIALMPFVVVAGVFLGPTYALMQRLVATEMRATTMAVVMLLANLIGMGIGPQVVGILSDALMPILGAESLRYAMIAMSFVALWAAWHFWLVGRTVKEDLAQVAQHAQSATVEIQTVAAAVTS
jgi:predicted MFS family arabinose efflux permease